MLEEKYPSITKTRSFDERLQHFPHLRDRLDALLDVVENSSGDILKADQAEQRVLDEIRLLGLDALQAWAQRKHSLIEKEYDERSDLTHKTKKNFTGTLSSGESK